MDKSQKNYPGKMMIRSQLMSLLVLIVLQSCADSQNKTNTTEEKERYEFIKYSEPADPDTVINTLWESVPASLQGSFGSIDERYPKSSPPILERTNAWKQTVWKGERASAQVVLWTSGNVGDISFKTGELKSSSGGKIDAAQIRMRFVRYLLTDEFAGGCGYRKKEDFAVALVADAIDEVDQLPMEPKTTRPVWVTIDVPQNTEEGVYQGEIVVIPGKGDGLTFDISLNVQRHTLPSPGDWSYHLDLWQNPYAVARYHGVEPWSESHFEYLEPLVKMLANAGQKCITASIIDKPWNGQTEDPFESMIRWTKKADGSWQYDYSIFDQWIEFAQKCGITKQINCYTMIPWELSFIYFDESVNAYDTLKASPGTEKYSALWKPFLKDFGNHLKEKKWFEKTTIAMDERPLEVMQEVIRLVKSVEPGFKISLAGNYHEEIAADIYDFCVASKFTIPEEMMEMRLQKMMPTTYYTCCTEPYPNNFTFSPPAEGTWQGWHAASRGYSGYLRWAYNSWVKEPLLDSRFRAWPAGDTYLVYPEARTSIRFERLREGIQDYEKIRILKAKLQQAGNTEMFNRLTDILAEFEITHLEEQPAEEMVNKGKSFIDELSSVL